MDQTCSYPQSQLPEKWFYQIISFQRLVFGDGFVGDNQYRNIISHPDQNPISFIIAHDDILIAHAQVLTKSVNHQGQTYQLLGPSGIFVYPAFRGQGYGKKVVNLAQDYIATQDGVDIHMISCEPHNVGFYQKCGYQFWDIGIQVGGRGNPEFSPEKVAYLLVSDKAKLHHHDFETTPLYFGEDMW